MWFSACRTEATIAPPAEGPVDLRRRDIPAAESGTAAAAPMAVPRNVRNIPNVDLVALCGAAVEQAAIQYETIDRLAELMGRSPAPHRHDDCLQIHFIEIGHFDLVLDDARCSGTGPALFVTPPSVPHVFTLSPDAAGHVLTLRQDLLWQIARQDNLLPQREALHAFCVGLAGADGGDAAAALRTAFGLLALETRSDGLGGLCARRSLAGFILAKVLGLRDRSSAAPTASPGPLALYRRFLELVEAHHGDHWPIARYAARLNVTQSRLYELCQLSAERSPKTILNDRIVQEARRYLAFSEASMKEVAGLLGFEDANYFFRFFKRLTGETPLTYRRRLRDRRKPEKVQ
jgi:AraC family 4-hydroxyphenylacetate 3-monooxygenase operon regulatory protein